MSYCWGSPYSAGTLPLIMHMSCTLCCTLFRIVHVPVSEDVMMTWAVQTLLIQAFTTAGQSGSEMGMEHVLCVFPAAFIQDDMDAPWMLKEIVWCDAERAPDLIG